MRKAIELLNQQPDEVRTPLMKKIGLTEQELKQWESRAEKILLPDMTGIIEQYEGFFTLEDAVIDQWDQNNMPMWPEKLKNVPREQRCILKQADVVMLLYLMEHDFPYDVQKKNFSYYEQRTLHRSSLSPSVHCLMGLRVGESRHAYEYLCRSAYVDIDNNQRNTKEGIHAASTGGTWQCITLGFCGMSTTADGELTFAPKLPDCWSKVSFCIRWRNADLRICVTQDHLSVIQESGPEAVPYWYCGERHTAERRMGKC